MIVATAGAGGDLQPLAALTLALQDRGNTIRVLGDASVERALALLGVNVDLLPSDLDLGPRLIGAIRGAMEATGGDVLAAGPLVQREMSAWAHDLAAPVRDAAGRFDPQACVTSLFGVEALDGVALDCPWVVVNSTFYVGPNPPRPLASDFGPRAIPLIERLASLLGHADLVLHATDQVFDLAFDGSPDHHHYVGPLGVWEPPSEAPPYLDGSGDPWVLVTISSQMQDDLPLARAAKEALRGQPVRVVLTVGADHRADDIGPAPANVWVEQTISHAHVLGRAELLVSHAGHGSVMKALTHGVPMVLVPWGRDQPGVAWRAAALGVAEVVHRDDATAGSLADAVDRVRANPAFRERALTHQTRLKATDPPSEAATLVETLLS